MNKYFLTFFLCEFVWMLKLQKTNLSSSSVVYFMLCFIYLKNNGFNIYFIIFFLFLVNIVIFVLLYSYRDYNIKFVITFIKIKTEKMKICSFCGIFLNIIWFNFFFYAISEFFKWKKKLFSRTTLEFVSMWVLGG